MNRRFLSCPSLALAVAVTFLGLVTALHFLRPEVDPFRDDLSVYAVGPDGYVMAMAFVALGTCVLAVAAALSFRRPRYRALRVGCFLLVISGLAVSMVAAFPSGAVSPETATDYAEVIASLTFFIGFGVASGVIAVSAWSGGRRVVASMLSGAFWLCFVTMLMGPAAIHGLLMRAAVGCVLGWLVANAGWLLGESGVRRRAA